MDTKGYADMTTAGLLELRRIKADLIVSAQGHFETIDAILAERDGELIADLEEAVRLSWTKDEYDDAVIDFPSLLRLIRRAGYEITKEG